MVTDSRTGAVLAPGKRGEHRFRDGVDLILTHLGVPDRVRGSGESRNPGCRVGGADLVVHVEIRKRDYPLRGRRQRVGSPSWHIEHIVAESPLKD
jgi:hypothetical protein